MVEIQLPFGLRDGRLFHISEVERGLGCNCVCPACREPLIARQGSHVIHHFAHKGTTCEHAVETALHLAAKAMLERERKIRLPSLEMDFENNKGSLRVFEEQLIHLDEVKLEQKLGSIVPDILVYAQGQPLIIEITVTHEVDASKLRKIQELGISTLEIDLRQFARNASLEALQEEIIYATRLKRWLYNTKGEIKRKELLRLGDYKRLISRDGGLHVDNCPLNKRFWQGKSYAKVASHCKHCKYFVSVNENWLICSAKQRLTDNREDI